MLNALDNLVNASSDSLPRIDINPFVLPLPVGAFFVAQISFTDYGD